MLNDLKRLIGIPESETDRDELLNWLIDSARARLKNLLGGMDVPESMNHIVTEVAVIRFNRIGSEGLSAHSVEGESQSFCDNDFAGFMDEIEAFLDQQKDAKRGRVRFL